MEQWIGVGGIVEQCWWNSRKLMVEQCDGTVEPC